MSQQKWLIDGPKTIEIDGIRKLKVGLVAGHVDVIAHDEPVVRVEVHSVSGKDLRVTADGDSLEIDHAQLSWENWLDVFRNFTPGAARAPWSVSGRTPLVAQVMPAPCSLTPAQDPTRRGIPRQLQSSPDASSRRQDLHLLLHS